MKWNCAAIQNSQRDMRMSEVAAPSVGSLNGKSVVHIDPSYAQRRNVIGGAGPGMFDGMCTAILLGVEILLTLAVTLAVGLSTWDPYKTAAAFAGTGSICAIFYAHVRISDPRA